MDKLTKMDKINLSLGITSIVGLIITICVSVWSVNQSKVIAEESGAFDKGILSLSFGGYRIQPNFEYDVYYGVNFADSLLHFSSIPLGIHNLGEKTLDNVTMLIKYPHMANIGVNDSLLKFDGIFSEFAQRKYYTVEPYDQVYYKFSPINPNFSIQCGDIICLPKETIAKEIIPIKTKDNKDINITTTFSYAYNTHITLTAKDIITKEYNLNFKNRSETNLNKLINSIIEEKINSKDKDDLIKSFFVIVPRTDKIIGDIGKQVVFMSSDNTNTFFCQFDTRMEFVAVFNQDLTINKQIKVMGKNQQ